ncbi:meiotic recombination protein SPO11-2 isoform X3 [Musa acuminata AAA Group]|uniref:meiotic recombination protein SPO11-2 isoform X3 n=1 Tax=Musa acuminata AAA Group TaxID=214697 RepID=UPI0031D47315
MDPGNALIGFGFGFYYSGWRMEDPDPCGFERVGVCLPRATIKSASVRILPPFAWKWSRISSNHRFSTPISGSAPPKSFLLRRFADHDLLSSSSSSSLYALLARSFSCNGLQVRARIEVAVLNFLKNLTASNPAISDLPLISRKYDNSGLRHGLLSDVSSVFLSHSVCTRSLMRANDAKAFVRVWMVMAMCFRILVQGKLATQRELFYKLLCDAPEYFRSQRQVNRTVQDVVALLRCTRHSLGIMASSRGAVIGRMVLEEPGEQIVDCSMIGHAGYAITGDLCTLSKLVLHSDARYIIIIEKDAIFQRLAEDHFFNQIPCILITSKGYPDIATRFLLHRISQTFPDMTILALMDWNPAGLAILCTYKFGSITTGLESYRYACNVKWLGLRADDLQIIPQQVMMQLKPHEIKTAKSLMSSKLLQERYQAELSLMVERGHRAEIEALYCHGFDFLGKYIAKKIVQADYI